MAKRTNIKDTVKNKKEFQGRNSKQSHVATRATKSKRSLNPIRQDLQKYVDEANFLASQLERQGIMSRALLEAQANLNKRGKERYGDTGELFSTDFKSYKELRREGARVHNFLTDETSRISAKTEADQFGAKYGNLFGAGFFDQYGVNYDFSVISEGKAQRMFSIYRRLEERYANLLQGRMGFGSENLISAIYEYMIDVPDWLPDENADTAIFNRASILLENYDFKRKIEAKNMTSSDDYGQLDTLRSARTAEEYLNRERWW